MSEETKALATVTTSTEKTLGQIQPTTMDEMWWLARAIGNAGIKPDALKSAADVLIVLMTGTELGLSAMQSLRGINVIKGKPALSADTMGAIVMGDHRCEYLQLTRWTANECEYETKRVGHAKPITVSFTMGDAKKADLLSNHMWSKYPQEMLKARALTKICRAVYPDICMGLYDPEELTSSFEPSRQHQKPISNAPESQQEEPKATEHQNDDLDEAIDVEFVAANSTKIKAEPEPQAEPEPTGPRDYSADPRHHEKTKWLYALVTDCGLSQDDGDQLREALKKNMKVASWKHLAANYIHAVCEALAKKSPITGENGELPERAVSILTTTGAMPEPVHDPYNGEYDYPDEEPYDATYGYD